MQRRLAMSDEKGDGEIEKSGHELMSPHVPPMVSTHVPTMVSPHVPPMVYIQQHLMTSP